MPEGDVGMSLSGQDRPHHTVADLRSGSPDRRHHPARVDFLDRDDDPMFASRRPAPAYDTDLGAPDPLTAALDRLAARTGARAPARDPLSETLDVLDRRLRDATPRAADRPARADPVSARDAFRDAYSARLSDRPTRDAAFSRSDTPAGDVYAPRAGADPLVRPRQVPPERDIPPARPTAASPPAESGRSRSADPLPGAIDPRVLEHFRALATQIDTLRLTQDQAFLTLQDAVEALRDRMAARDRELDPAVLGRQLSDLEAQLARLAADVPDRQEFTALRETLIEMREARADIDADTGTILGELSHGQARLTARLEDVARAFAESSPSRALAEIARRLDALDARQVDPALLSALGERLERLAEHGLDAPVARALTERVSELASALEDTARKSDVDRLERGTQRLGALLEKVNLKLDAQSDGGSEAALTALTAETRDLRTRLDRYDPAKVAEVVATGLGALDRLAEDVRRSMREARESATADLTELSRRLDAFEARLSHIGPDVRTGAALERLEAALSGISRELSDLADRAVQAQTPTAEVITERLATLDARLEQAEERTSRDIRRKVDEQLQALAAEMKARAGGPISPGAAGASAAPFAMTPEDTEDRTGGPVTMKLRAELRRLKEAAAQQAAPEPEDAEPETAPPMPGAPSRLDDVPGAGDLIAAARRAARPLQRTDAAPPMPVNAPPQPTPHPAPAPARASEDPAAGPVVYPARPLTADPPRPLTADAASRAAPEPKASASITRSVAEALGPLVGSARAATDTGFPARSSWRLPGHRTLMSATAAAAVVSGAAYLVMDRMPAVNVTPDSLVADRGRLAADIARLAERQRQQAEDPEMTGSIADAPAGLAGSDRAALTAPTLTAPALTAPATETTAGAFQPARPATGPAAPPLIAPPTAPAPPATATPSAGGRAVASAPASADGASLDQSDLPAAPGLKPTPVLPRAIGPLSLRSAAENGDPLAAHEIGMRYLDGRGVPADSSLALAWFHKAAEAGSVPGVFRVASMYEKGVGVAANLKVAASWYRVAAEAGNVKAMHNLAVLLSEGAEGERDFAAAAHWFEEAARRGLADSQYNIGVLYAQGMGVTYDLPTAWRWFSLAAAQGDPEAAEQRDIAGERLDGAELANARAALKAWRPEPVDPGVNSVPPINPGWMDTGSST